MIPVNVTQNPLNSPDLLCSSIPLCHAARADATSLPHMHPEGDLGKAFPSIPRLYIIISSDVPDGLRSKAVPVLLRSECS